MFYSIHDVATDQLNTLFSAHGITVSTVSNITNTIYYLYSKYLLCSIDAIVAKFIRAFVTCVVVFAVVWRNKDVYVINYYRCRIQKTVIAKQPL